MDAPWVDDILIKKYVLGEVTVHTGLAYDDRWDYSQPAEGVQVRLYEADPGGEDDLLFLDYASAEGYFDISPLLNWDEDGGEQNPEDRRLDLYVCWVTENEYYSITNIASSPYGWCSETRENIGVDDEWFYYGLPQGNTTLPAMWIYQDIRRSRQYYIDHTYLQIDPGYIKAHWENGVNSENVPDSHFWALGDPHVFIADQNAESTDIVVHETGHQIMWNLNGLWLWNEFSCWYHDIWSEESPQCAWSEGWSDFYALQVNNDSCFDKALDLCGEEDEYNLENHTRLDFDNPWGDGVEGRVAGALMDWVDMNNETPWYDDAHLPFDTIAEILPNPNVVTLSLFWSEYWGSFRHEAVRSIFQNTIDYNHSPVINPIEDRTILQDSSISHLINLLDYIGDWESDGWQLDYSIDYSSDVNCGISLDEHWVDLTPAAGWVGDCFVRYTVSDSLAETTSNTSLIRIEEITERMYLPLIIIN